VLFDVPSAGLLLTLGEGPCLILLDMAFDAVSPLGVSWGYLVLALLPLLVVAAVALLIVRAWDVSPLVGVLLVATLMAGLWTLLTIGDAVLVPIAQDEDGAECLVNAFGGNADQGVSWGSPCGRGLAGHLVLSAGPTLLMLGITSAATAQGWRRRRRGPASETEPSQTQNA
jgi:hypothetical protein